MLQMAKANLASMDYFALYEYPVLSDYLLAWTFGIEYRMEWSIPFNTSSEASGFLASNIEVLDDAYRSIDMDLYLYSFAKQLFFRRVRDMLFDDMRHKSKLQPTTEQLLLEEISSLIKKLPCGT